MESSRRWCGEEVYPSSLINDARPNSLAEFFYVHYKLNIRYDGVQLQREAALKREDGENPSRYPPL